MADVAALVTRSPRKRRHPLEVAFLLFLLRPVDKVRGWQSSKLVYDERQGLVR